MHIKTLIVDDEMMARKSLERLCESNKSVYIVGSVDNAIDALGILKGENIDLLLLDIEMPNLSGIELLERLDSFPQIVFTTSNKDYAFDAYEYEVTDFLIKPIVKARFLKAIGKVEEKINQLFQSTSFSAAKEVYVKEDGRYIRIPYQDILYFENAGDYVKVCTLDKVYIIYGALKNIDAKLSYPGFLKVHRSYIVNLEKIKDIEDNTLVINKKVIPISRAHKPTLMQTINVI